MTQSNAASVEDWLTPFEGSGIEWHESLPSPYTYQASDFNKLVAAVHEYEYALIAARAALRRQPKPKPDGGQIHG